MKAIQQSDIRVAVREGAIVVVASLALGFGYAYLFAKGIFAPAGSTITHTATQVPPQFISYEEAQSLFDADSALFVDARHDFDYRLGHIKGAINVPLKDFEFSTSPLAGESKKRLIVTYCDGADCNSSIELAKKLSESGFMNVKMFFGGWNEWQMHNQATE